MEETFTEHQVRVALGLLGWSDGAVENALNEMRKAPPRPGVGGYSDDELKGTARDEGFVIDPDGPSSIPEGTL